MEGRGRKSASSSKQASGGYGVLSPPWATVDAVEAGAGAGSEGGGGGADTAGGGRPYYECGFCKNGFATPQALGGHMNMHRRDRARGRTAAGTASPAAPWSGEGYGYDDVHHHQASYAYPPAPPATRSSFDAYFFPGASASSYAAGGGYDAVVGGAGSSSAGTRELLSLQLGVAADTHGPDLSLGLGWNGHGHGGDGRPSVSGGSSEWQAAGEPEESDQLDLELRLGLGRHPGGWN